MSTWDIDSGAEMEEQLIVMSNSHIDNDVDCTTYRESKDEDFGPPR